VLHVLGGADNAEGIARVGIRVKQTSGGKRKAAAITARGGVDESCTQREPLSLLTCRRLLLEGLDSSISGRIACKSSVAETTGKSRIRMQPSASRQDRELKRAADWADPACRRHSQYAGSASISQNRLRISSMLSYALETETEKPLRIWLTPQNFPRLPSLANMGPGKQCHLETCTAEKEPTQTLPATCSRSRHHLQWLRCL
jgi:hypothetical protein